MIFATSTLHTSSMTPIHSRSSVLCRSRSANTFGAPRTDTIYTTHPRPPGPARNAYVAGTPWPMPHGRWQLTNSNHGTTRDTTRGGYSHELTNTHTHRHTCSTTRTSMLAWKRHRETLESNGHQLPDHLKKTFANGSKRFGLLVASSS